MSVLTAEARMIIRTAISDVVRAQWERDLQHRQACNGCGGELEGWTLGCYTCGQRHHRKFKEGRHPDPAFYQMRTTQVEQNRAAQRSRTMRERSAA